MFIRHLIIFIALGLSSAYAYVFNVQEIARASLEVNIVHLKSGDFLAAGPHQFKSLWTRDFCFSVPALLTLKKYSLVKNQLNYLITNRRSDGLVPIYADSMSPMQRVTLASVNNILGTNFNYPITDKLTPYFKASGKFPTIDANILILLASYEYYQATLDQEWWEKNQKNFREIYNYYQKFTQDGLIFQGAFSDWQDSSKRVGKTFFTNLLYLEVSKYFHFLSHSELDLLTNKIHETFYDPSTGLYFSVAGEPYISIDGILWALQKKLMPNLDAMYFALKKHPLWNRFEIPGYATFPSYPKSWIISHVKLSGLSEYHGNLSWSWLIALSSTVAKQYGDLVEAERISSKLQEILLRDNFVGEIYESKNNYRLFHSSLYKSENPFSLGSAFVIEMLKDN
jgi:hypothetical protein